MRIRQTKLPYAFNVKVGKCVNHISVYVVAYNGIQNEIQPRLESESIWNIMDAAQEHK